MTNRYEIGQHVAFEAGGTKGDGIIKQVFVGPEGASYLLHGCWVDEEFVTGLVDWKADEADTSGVECGGKTS